MHLRIALASQRSNAQLITVPDGGVSLSVLLNKAAAKHKLKSTKKKPLSLFTDAGLALIDGEFALSPGQLLLLCVSEGDLKEMRKLETKTAEQARCGQPSQRGTAVENGTLPEELWERVFRFVRPVAGRDGLPIHLLYPPAHPQIVPAAAQVCRLFAREIPRLFAYGGQWFFGPGAGKAAGAEWRKYEPRANSDIEVCFMRGEASRTVEVCGQAEGPRARPRHVAVNFEAMTQTNLSKKGPIPAETRGLPPDEPI